MERRRSAAAARSVGCCCLTLLLIALLLASCVTGIAPQPQQQRTSSDTDSQLPPPLQQQKQQPVARDDEQLELVAASPPFFSSDEPSVQHHFHPLQRLRQGASLPAKPTLMVPPNAAHEAKRGGGPLKGQARLDRKRSAAQNNWLSEISASPAIPYNINVGRSKFRDDVVSQDKVKPMYYSDQTLETGVDVDAVSDFYIWRDEDAAQAGGNSTGAAVRSINVQKPIVFIDDVSIVEATIESWGERALRRVAAFSDDSIRAHRKTRGRDSAGLIEFSLSLQCKKVGKTMITINLRVFETTADQRSKSTLEWRVKRSCDADNPLLQDIVDAEASAKTAAEGGSKKGSSKRPAESEEKSKIVHEATAESSVVSGFNVRFTADEKVIEVVTDGKPADRFKPRSSSTAEAAATADAVESERSLEAAYHVGEAVSRLDLHLSIASSHEKSLRLSTPIIYIEHPEIISLSHNMDKHRVSPGQSPKLALSFTCLSAGQSSFTIMLTFANDVQSQVSFGAVKVCGARTERRVGLAGSMIDVGLGSECGENVVDDGETMKPYTGVSSWNKMAWKGHAAALPTSQSKVEFCVSTSAEDAVFAYSKPQISAFTADGMVIAAPILHGSMIDEGKPLSKSAPQSLFVDFKCKDLGIVAVSLSVPFTDLGVIQWTLRKICGSEEVMSNKKEEMMLEASRVDEGTVAKEDDISGDGDQTGEIPGLNLGFSRSQHGQMWNGVVNETYRLQQSLNELAFCPGRRQFLTFYLYQNSSVPKAQPVRYGLPVLISTNQITNPLLSGDLEGGVVNSTDHATFALTFHCHTDGETMFTLRIPLLAYTEVSAGKHELFHPPPRSSIVIQFIKICNSSDAVSTVEIGGVGVQGFRIGFSPNASDPESQAVVRDGFPLVPYFGQKDLDDPEWSGVIVEATENSTRLYFNYVGGENVGSKYVSFYPPRLVFHSSYFQPTLSGPATRGGKIRRNTASPPSLDITYNCLFKGLLTLTLVIPMPHGSITFTLPKRCAGAAAVTGRTYPGLLIGLTPGGGEVVTDGLVQPQFGPKGAFVVPASSDVTTFYLQKLGGDVFQAIEPLVRAIKPIAYAELEHNLYISVGPSGQLLQQSSSALQGDEKLDVEGDVMQDELDDVYLDEKIATLNVTYACLDQGSTLVTLSMPLKIGYIDFTWTKECDFKPQRAGVVPGGSNGINAVLDLINSFGGGGSPSSDADENDDNDTVEESEHKASSVDVEGGVARVVGGAPEQSLHASIQAPVNGRSVPSFGGDEPDVQEDETTLERLARERVRLVNEDRKVYENNPDEQHSTPLDFNRPETLSVGTTPKLAASTLAADVVRKGKLISSYRPNSGGKLDLRASSASLIGADVKSLTFYVHTSAEQQVVGIPEVIFTSQAKHAAHVLNIELGGPLKDDARQETVLYSSQEAQPLTIAFTCLPGHGGTVPFIVEIPLMPKAAAASVRFALYKVCPDTRGSRKGSQHGFYFLLVLLLGGAMIGLVVYLRSQGRQLDVSAMLDLTRRQDKHKLAPERGQYEIVKGDDA